MGASEARTKVRAGLVHVVTGSGPGYSIRMPRSGAKRALKSSSNNFPTF